MVRISDARMSGTAYGTVALHVAPEGVSGARWPPSATGHHRRSTCRAASLDLEVRRRRSRPASPISNRRRRKYRRGYGAMFLEHVSQADQGCDFDFLQGRSENPEEEPYGVLRGMVGGW